MEFDYAVIWSGLSFAVRWLHIITGIAWIGSSFYFIALDLGLRQSDDLPTGAAGEEWQGAWRRFLPHSQNIWWHQRQCLII